MGARRIQLLAFLGYFCIFTCVVVISPVAAATASLHRDGPKLVPLSMEEVMLLAPWCYKITCDHQADLRWCKKCVSVTVTATNFCPPNFALPNDDGGWCNPPLHHLDMAQPAWEKIDIYSGLNRPCIVLKGAV
ncbi:hypothetical protein MLD38_024832 [Melastoma candidum]|uniref:Uncharacterized protein n=1 Tax=Melastoma candidum TaxID=119954 RepID=A0ACB9P0B6_9MYRT|nr:hypothetical protein MLD38_024832 [Melastoma candidum]